MSCNCNTGSCQLPVQPKYNLLDKGYIFKKDSHSCDCQNIDLPKHIIIDNNHLYPNDGIYVDIDNKILHLQIIPNHYEYRIDLDTIIVNGDNVSNIYVHFDENINTNDIKKYNICVNKSFSENLYIHSDKEFTIICNAIKDIHYTIMNNLYLYNIPSINNCILLEFDTKNNIIIVNSDKNYIDDVYVELQSNKTRIGSIENYLERNEVEEDDITVSGLFNAGSLDYHYLKFGNVCTLIVEDLQLKNGFTEQYYPIPFAAAKESTIRICGIDEENNNNVELIATILSSSTNEDVDNQLSEKNPSCLVIRKHDKVLNDPAYSASLPNGYVSFAITYKIID